MATITPTSQPAGDRIPHGDVIDELQGREPARPVPHVINTAVIDCRPGWGWSVGMNTGDHSRFVAYVLWPDGRKEHGLGCEQGIGDSPQAALDDAYAKAWEATAVEFGVPGMDEPTPATETNEDDRAEAEREDYLEGLSATPQHEAMVAATEGGA